MKKFLSLIPFFLFPGCMKQGTSHYSVDGEVLYSNPVFGISGMIYRVSVEVDRNGELEPLSNALIIINNDTLREYSEGEYRYFKEIYEFCSGFQVHIETESTLNLYIPTPAPPLVEIIQPPESSVETLSLYQDLFSVWKSCNNTNFYEIMVISEAGGHALRFQAVVKDTFIIIPSYVFSDTGRYYLHIRSVSGPQLSSSGDIIGNVSVGRWQGIFAVKGEGTSMFVVKQ
jgi:hypothetical protein